LKIFPSLCIAMKHCNISPTFLSSPWLPLDLF
jgi:hypothetical protein